MSPTLSDNMETECTAQEELVSKPKNNGSLIWRWFGLKCQMTSSKMFSVKPVATKRSSTRNLFHYLQQRHKGQYKECVKMRAATQASKPRWTSAPKQTLLLASFTLGVPYERTSNKVITEAESLPSDQVSCLSELPDPAVTEPADQSEAAVAVPPTAKRKISLASFFEHSTPTTSTTRTQKDAVETDLSSYLLSVCVESGAKMVGEVNFPALSRLAKKCKPPPPLLKGCLVAVGTFQLATGHP